MTEWSLVGTVALTYAKQIANFASTKSAANNANQASSYFLTTAALQTPAPPTAQPALPPPNAQSAHQAILLPTANALNAYRTVRNARTPLDAKTAPHRLL